jgi:hypothetical protein
MVSPWMRPSPQVSSREERPGDIVDGKGAWSLGCDKLEAIVGQAYLTDKGFGEIEPLPGPHVSLAVAACPFRARDEIDFPCTCFEGLEKVERLYPPAAGQRKESHLRSQLLFQWSPVCVLLRVKLATKEYCDVPVRMSRIRHSSPPKKRAPVRTSPSFIRNAIVRKLYTIASKAAFCQ